MCTIEMNSINLHETEMNSNNFHEIKLHSNNIQETDLNSDKQQVVVSWKDITAHWVPPKKFHLKSCFKGRTKPPLKQVLNNVSGMAKPGELLAIMGASGAGKTTLLNVLTMKRQKNFTMSGQVFLNNQPLTSKMVAAFAAYIQQDNLFIGTLTVKEQLIFQARLTMGNTTYTEKLKRVNEVMVELGLTKSQDTLIGIAGRIKGISGGESRRLAVGCELLTNPRLLFCDEPTSGLDTSMAQSVVTMLRNLAMKGKTVICTIHQPSSEIYALFNKVLFLAEGRVAYLGSREGALEHFENLNLKCPINYNPADYFIHTLAVTADNKAEKLRTISEVCNHFEKSGDNVLMKQEIDCVINNEKINLPDQIRKSRYKVPWIEQFRAVLWRSFLSVCKDPMLVNVRLLQSLLIGLCLGFFYYHPYQTSQNVGNINGAVYILLINITYQNMFAVIHVFGSELPIFAREHSGGLYGPGVYFFCKTLADQLVFIIGPILFTIPSYWLIGFVPNASNFFFACLIMILVANCASSFGYLISSVTSSLQMALSVGPSCIVPLLLFGGYFIRTNSLPWYFSWISHVSWFAYGFDSMLLNQWKNIQHIDCDVDTNSTCEINGSEVLHKYDLESAELLPRLFELLGLVVCIRMAAFIVFAIRAKIKS